MDDPLALGVLYSLLEGVVLAFGETYVFGFSYFCAGRSVLLVLLLYCWVVLPWLEGASLLAWVVLPWLEGASLLTLPVVAVERSFGDASPVLFDLETGSVPGGLEVRAVLSVPA